MSDAYISFDVDDYLDKASRHALVRELAARIARGDHILDELIDEKAIIDMVNDDDLKAEIEFRGYQVFDDEEFVVPPADWRTLAEYIAQGDIKEALYFMESIKPQWLCAGALINRYHNTNLLKGQRQ